MKKMQAHPKKQNYGCRSQKKDGTVHWSTPVWSVHTQRVKKRSAKDKSPWKG
jgi:hypothetical protein